jgi:hypothetical protein
MNETGNTANAEQPEFRSLQDATVAEQIAAASYRQFHDRLIATWRDWLENFLRLNPNDYTILHKVIDSMDDFLNHRSHK